VLALRAASPASRTVTLGTVDVRVAPARGGRLDVYVPVVDWGVRARPYRAPLAVDLEFRSLDREAALAALRSGGAADANLGLLRHELSEAVADGLRRAALLALIGAGAGGLVGGALLAAWGRRRWLALGPAAGVTVVLAVVVLTGASVSRFDYGALREPTFYARGGELPRLLAFSERLFADGDGYRDSYGAAVAGLTQLIAVAGEQEDEVPYARTIVVASDLHSNALVLPALAEFTRGKMVLVAGDLTQRGARYERPIVGEVAGLGSPVVAVSGNHDSRPLMRAAASAGVIVLTRSGRLGPDGSVDGRPVVSLGGLLVAGWDDPAESPDGAPGRRPLELAEGALVSSQRALLAWFDGLPERPDVVLVHRHELAHALLDQLADEGGEPVIVVTGHDHRGHVERSGAHVLVDGGSVGADGVFGVGQEASGFAQVHLDVNGRARAVDLIEVEPATGEGRAHRVRLDGPPPGGPAGEAGGF
jgi:predicted phosphodiesterase